MKRLSLFLLPFLTSCAPVFTAEIAGYILDAETYEGIPGVEVRLYKNKPANYADDSFLYQTSTGNDANLGLFNQTVIWNDYLAQYGKDGDVIDMHFTIVHPQYQSKIESTIGIVSGAVNTIPSILLNSTNASVEKLQGSVTNENILTNGIQVALYLGEEEIAYERTITQPINGVDGQYLFENIEWRDILLEGKILATVIVDDPRYTNSSPAEATQEIFNQENTDFLPEMNVDLVRPSIFEANISGKTTFLIETKNTAEYRPISGIEVTLEWFYDDENQSIPKRDIVRTNDDGIFSTTIAWEDDTPDENNSVPSGEDQLDVEISYPAGGIPGFSYDLTAFNDTYTIRSWIENTLPTAYEYVPLPPEEE